MPRYRDVEAFDERSAGYEQGWLGRLHHEIADRTADVALAVAPSPARILDVGCGTGYLLRLLASRYPEAAELAGVDPAPGMIKVAAASAAPGAPAAPGVPGVPGAPAVPGAPGVPGAPAGDERLKFSAGVAEQLPYQDGSFDLVVSVTSFDHWSDQLAGLRECHRVLVPGGHLVLVDQLSSWLVPTLIFSRSGKARTKGRAGRLVGAAGFGSVAWHGVYAVIINAVTATA